MTSEVTNFGRMVGYLNNEEKDGGFWLPNIQRPFVGGTYLFDGFKDVFYLKKTIDYIINSIKYDVKSYEIRVQLI